MGQYFRIANVDKKEYIELSSKLWEICANNDCRILPYLLADGNKDGVGSGLLTCVEPEEVEEFKKRGYAVVNEPTESFRWYLMEKVTKYFGRWWGDRIVVAGDYGYSGIYEAIKNDPGWKDITEEAVKEFNEFIEIDELKITGIPQRINPDMIITPNGAYMNPKL